VHKNAPFEERAAFAAISFKGYIFLTGGNGSGILNDIWKSGDGIKWELVKESASFPDREDHSMVAYKDNLYIIGGSGS